MREPRYETRAQFDEFFREPILEERLIEEFEKNVRTDGSRGVRRHDLPWVLSQGIRNFRIKHDELKALREEHYSKIQSGDRDTVYTLFTVALSNFVTDEHLAEIALMSRIVLDEYSGKRESIPNDFPGDLRAQELLNSVLSVMECSRLTNRGSIITDLEKTDISGTQEIPLEFILMKERAAGYLEVCKLLSAWFPDIMEVVSGSSVVDHPGDRMGIVELVSNPRYTQIGDWGPKILATDFNKVEINERTINAIHKGFAAYDTFEAVQ